MHELVTDTAAVTWSKFRRIYPKLSADVPLIKYNNRLKVTAGWAYFDRGYIEISTELLWQHGEKFASHVIEHEYGHLVAFSQFNDTTHGAGWLSVMRSIGGCASPYHPFINHLHETRKLVRMAR